MKITIRFCARCQKIHQNLEFKAFTHRPPKYSHWAVCPNTGEPILLYITEE